ARGRGRGAGRERLPLPADDHRRSQGRHGCRRDHRAVSAPLAASPLEPAGTVRGARWRARAAVATVVMLALLAGWLLWDNRRLEVTTYQVEVTGLAGSTEGLRIVQLSDRHAADFGDFTQRLVDQVRAAEPDLVAVTGDLVDLHTRDLAPVLELMARLDRIAPVHLVLGNHEAESPVADELLEGLATVGVEVLRDQARSVTVRWTENTLAGLDDPHVAHLAGGEPRDPGAALEGLQLPVGPPVVLLAHRPEPLARYAAAGGRGAVPARPWRAGPATVVGRAVRPESGLPAGPDRGAAHRRRDDHGDQPAPGQQPGRGARGQPPGTGGRGPDRPGGALSTVGPAQRMCSSPAVSSSCSWAACCSWRACSAARSRLEVSGGGSAVRWTGGVTGLLGVS